MKTEQRYYVKIDNSKLDSDKLGSQVINYAKRKAKSLGRSVKSVSIKIGMIEDDFAVNKSTLRITLNF